MSFHKFHEIYCYRYTKFADINTVGDNEVYYRSHGMNNIIEYYYRGRNIEVDFIDSVFFFAIHQSNFEIVISAPRASPFRNGACGGTSPRGTLSRA